MVDGLVDRHPEALVAGVIVTTHRASPYSSLMARTDRSRRQFFGLVAASAAWLVLPTPAHARRLDPAIVQGGPCKKLGRERTVNGVTFACRKVKGKLVWQRLKFATVTDVVTARVLDSSALAVGSSAVIDVPLPAGGTTGVVVTRTETGLTALRVNCTHQGFPVARAGKVLECELHGSQFDPATGAVITGPATRPLLNYSVNETDGGIFVTIKP